MESKSNLISDMVDRNPSFKTERLVPMIFEVSRAETINLADEAVEVPYMYLKRPVSESVHFLSAYRSQFLCRENIGYILMIGSCIFDICLPTAICLLV